LCGIAVAVAVGATSAAAAEPIAAAGLADEWADPGLAPPAADDPCMQEIRRCCGDCCPTWTHYAIFDVLFLQRNNQIGNSPLVYDAATIPPTPVMTAQDLQPGLATGTRVFYGQLVTDSWGWEVGYLGIYGMFGDAVANADGTLQLPPDLNGAVSNFGEADTIRGTYWSTLNMAECNIFHYRCCPECGPLCRRNCHCAFWMAGFIWAGLDEQAALSATCCNPPEASIYSVNTSTNYFGPQIGMRGRREWCRWAVEGWWKTALCGTSASQSQAPIVDTVTNQTVRPGNADWVGGVGFIGQLNGTLIYRITDVWGLRLGYNLIWLTDATLAPSQWDFSTLTGAGSRLNNNGDIFLHGVNLGVEARW